MAINKSKTSLSVFLCHASGDKPAVRKLYRRLKTDGYKPWLDEEDLLPGQDWRYEIPKAVRAANVVIACLSRKSITKEGYVQKEIKIALDVADEKPGGTIFIIPLKLEECIVPERLNHLHSESLLNPNGYERLVPALHTRAATLATSASPAVGTNRIKSRTVGDANPRDSSEKARTLTDYLLWGTQGRQDKTRKDKKEK
jgi:hypothetical protein